MILLKIDYIFDICENGIVKALEDEKISRPAILMHLTSIAEQFSKLLDSDIIKRFDKEDIKGAINTRNFIAHDYEGINLPIIEFIIRDRLPILEILSWRYCSFYLIYNRIQQWNIQKI